MSVDPVRLGVFPTPLQRAPRLAAAWGLPELLLKRDDLTGFAWGGNKVRTVEYILADVLARQADLVVVAGGPRSNFAALLAVAAAGQGVAVRQVCYGRPRPAAALSVSRAAGADVEFTGSDRRAGMDERAAAIAEEVAATGGRPYVVPRGGATAIGALGFAGAGGELVGQLGAADLTGVRVVLPVGSGGSISGLLAGLAAGDPQRRVDSVVGVAVTRAPHDLVASVTERAASCAKRIGAPCPSTDWRLVDGRSQDPGPIAARMLRVAGLVTDPVYTAKAIGWLSQSAEEVAGGPVVYWSTGGLLAAADDLTSSTRKDQP